MAGRDNPPTSPGYIKMLGRDSQDMEDLISSLQERVAFLENEKESLQQELQTTHKTLQDFTQEANLEKQRLVGELHVIKQQRKYLEKRVNEHKQATRELEERILYLEKKLQKKDDQLKMSPDKFSITELQERVEYLEKKVNTLEAEKIAYLKEKESLNLQKETTVIMKDLDDVVSQRNSEIQRLSAHIEGMKRELEDMQHLVDNRPTTQTTLTNKPHPQPLPRSNKPPLPRYMSEPELRKKKGATISRMFNRQSLNNDPHQYSLPPSPPLAPPKLVNFNWEREVKDAPRMSRGTAIVDGQNAVCYFSLSVSPEIHVYELHTKVWNKLPDCPHLSFGMAIVNSCLTAVGGEKGHGPTGDLISYVSCEDRPWVEMLPAMTVKRSHPSTVSSDNYLIVVGGVTQELEPKSPPRKLDSVEIMNTDTLTWSQAAPLPRPAYSLSLAVCKERNLLYLLGGEGAEQSAFVCNIPKLINSHAIHTSHTHHHNHHAHHEKKVWRVIEDVPTAYATCAVIHDHLVAFGGIEGNRESSKRIFAYNDYTEKWSDTGLLPTPRSRPLVVSLPGGVVMVVGGFTRVGMLGIVEVATVEDGRNLRADSF